MGTDQHRAITDLSSPGKCRFARLPHLVGLAHRLVGESQSEQALEHRYGIGLIAKLSGVSIVLLGPIQIIPEIVYEASSRNGVAACHVQLVWFSMVLKLDGRLLCEPEVAGQELAIHEAEDDAVLLSASILPVLCQCGRDLIVEPVRLANQMVGA